ncbi:hypothetical protein, partial [Novipirellula sp.]|uniref:hypothetical protein n=1 Tax=Novipirellula sp. TaxID=2795430 RepID=UPI0035682210
TTVTGRERGREGERERGREGERERGREGERERGREGGFTSPVGRSESAVAGSPVGLVVLEVDVRN